MSIEVTGENDADSPQFIPFLNGTVKNINIREISADKAYSARNNLNAGDNIGATPYLAFKNNAQGYTRGSPLWNKMYHSSSSTKMSSWNTITRGTTLNQPMLRSRGSLERR